MISQDMSLKSRISRRDILKLAGGTATAAILAACGAPATQEPEVGEEEPTEPEVGEEAPGAGGSIVWWHGDYSTRKYGEEPTHTPIIETLGDRLPGIEVEQVVVTEAMFDKLQASVAAGDPPDVAPVDQTQLAPMRELDAINPMPKGLIDVEAEFGRFVAEVYAMGEDKDYYLLPGYWFERGCFYNMTLLSERGITPEDLPKKISDLIPFAQELTEWPSGADEPSVAAWPLGGGTTFDFYTACIDNFGGFWWLDDTHCGFGEPEWEEAWRLTLAMFDVWNLDAREGTNAIDRFYNGNALFLPQQTWVGFVLRNDYPDVDWGIMTNPTPNGGPPYGWKEGTTDMGNLSIKTGVDYDASWELWKLLYGHDWQRANSLSINTYPPRLDVQGEEPFVESNPQWAGIVEKHKTGNSVMPGFWPQELWKTTNEAWEAVYYTDTDVGEALQTAQQAADAALAASPLLAEGLVTKKEYADNPDWTDGKIPIDPWWDGVLGSYLTSEQQAALEAAQQ
jgi:hypothetical protein